MQRRHVAAADAVFLLGQHDDRAALGRFVGQRGKLRRIGQFALARHPAAAMNSRRLAIAERDGAGLVEQQRIDVARRLDRAAGHRQHVEAHQPIHAGDADRRQQRADGGRNQRDEQRDQHQHRQAAAGIGRRSSGSMATAKTKMIVMPASRMLSAISFGVFWRCGALDQRDHAVEEGRARRRGDAHLDPVGDHLRAAGHGRAVAAALADHRRGFAGDRGFVDRGDAFDHLAVARDEIAGLDQHDIARLESRLPATDLDAARASMQLGRWSRSWSCAGVAACALPRPFRHRFGEIGEQHREPEPEIDLEARMPRPSAPATRSRRNRIVVRRRDDLDHEHHRVVRT